MNYPQLPLSALLRGPVLHTPQGMVLLVASTVYVLVGLLSFAIGEKVATPSVAEKFGVWCLLVPLVLFVLFVRMNGPKFQPSKANAAWGTLLAALPILVVLLGW